MAEATLHLTKGEEIHCCVADCPNSSVNTEGREPPVRFYSFPGKWVETERRRAWVAAVRGANPEGTAWNPTPRSRICSIHFVGNSRRHKKDHPAYIPTIFPSICKKEAPDPEENVQRVQSDIIQEALSRPDRAGEQPLPQSAAETTVAAPQPEISNDVDLKRDEQDQQIDCGDNSVGEATAAKCIFHVQAHSAVHLSSTKKAGKSRTIYSSKACQTKGVTVGKLDLILSMTNGAEACTQVIHVQQTDQVTVTNGS